MRFIPGRRNIFNGMQLNDDVSCAQSRQGGEKMKINKRVDA